MWSQLNVWIMAPGSACEIDDRKHWVVYGTNAHGQKFVWKNVDYSGGLKVGANGHLEVEIPPGTYIMWAEYDHQGLQMRTHKAVVAVHAEPFVVVRLLPDPLLPDYPTPTDKPDQPFDGPDPDPDEPKDCEIRIEAVQGFGGENLPNTIVVRGTASDCGQVVVSVRHEQHDGDLQGTAPVAGDGTWELKVENGLKLRCGDAVTVTAMCEDNRRCRGRGEFEVECPER